MPQTTRINISPIMAGIVGVLVEPYKEFVVKLRQEGRISDEEVQGLRAALEEATANLGEKISANPPEGWDSL
jgi:hypothetical protein